MNSIGVGTVELLFHSLSSRSQYRQTPFRHSKVWREGNKCLIQAFWQHIDIFRKRTGNIHNIRAISDKCIISKDLCYNAPTNVWSIISVHQRESIGQRDIGLRYCKGVARHALNSQDGLDCRLPQDWIRGTRIEKRQLRWRAVFAERPYHCPRNPIVVCLRKFADQTGEAVRVSVEPRAVRKLP